MRSTPLSGRLLVIVLLTGAAGLAADCGNVNAVLEQVSEARQLAGDLAVQFTKASDAANRAVMADTDDASVVFAKESREAADAVQKDVSTLRPKLESLGFSEETGLLNQFAGRFAEYRTLDQRILDLAVENTNLKRSASHSVPHRRPPKPSRKTSALFDRSSNRWASPRRRGC